MEIRFHVWKSNNPDILGRLGFTERNGYWDRLTESQMDKHYIKVYVNDCVF